MAQHPYVTSEQLQRLLDQSDPDLDKMEFLARRMHVGMMFCPSREKVIEEYIPQMEKARERMPENRTDAMNYRIGEMKKHCGIAA